MTKKEKTWLKRLKQSNILLTFDTIDSALQTEVYSAPDQTSKINLLA